MVSLRCVDSADNDAVRWNAIDRTGVHQDNSDLVFNWREYQVEIPTQPNTQITPGRLRSLALALAEIRLFGGRHGDSDAPMDNYEVRSKCNPQERDMARTVALVLTGYHGNFSRGKFRQGFPRFLVANDPEDLRDQLPFAAKHFVWSTEDPDCPDATSKYHARVHRVDKPDDVYVTFADDRPQLFKTILPLKEFKHNGFQEIIPGTEFRLFRVREDGGYRLVPKPEWH